MRKNVKELMMCSQQSDDLNKFNENVAVLLDDYERLTVEVKQKKEQKKIEHELLSSNTNVLE